MKAMTIVMGLDQHRAQITAEWIDTSTGEVTRRRVARADRAGVRRFLSGFRGQRLEVALEATTGWRFVVEELRRIGARVHLAEPTETAARKGKKKRAKTDRTDARHLRELLMVGRLPECWIASGHILDLRARVRLRHTLSEQRSEWQQRIQAVLYHRGCPPASALIQHVRDSARGEFNLLSAAGSEVERELGWGVARSLFEPWLMRLPEGGRADLLTGPAASASLLFAPNGEAVTLPPCDASFAILHGLYWLVVRAAEAQPTLLVIDDAHWADEPSLRLLTYLVDRIRDQPVGVLVAARSGETDAAGLLAHLAGDRDVTVCEPAPLSVAAITTLIQQRLPDADEMFCRRCHELTAGNPLGVREVLLAIANCQAAATARDLETIADRAAHSLSRSVLRRLASLIPEARALADAMSVFEVRAELQWAAALVDLEPAAALAALDQLERVDILRGEDEFVFTHPLLRTIIYRALPRGRKGQLHRRAATVLHAAHLSPECVASHLLASPATGDGEVVEILRDAARCAMAHGVPASAARYLERALREPPSDECRVQLLAELGLAEASSAPHRAIEHLEAAIDLARDPEQRAALAVGLGRALHDAGRPEDACATFERGLAELQDDSGELAAELEAWYLTAALLVPKRVRDAHRRADEVAAKPGIASTPTGRLLVSRSITVLVRAGRSHEQVLSDTFDGYERPSKRHAAW
jgi:tetratricopeptide (TPR) repeat protein